MFFTFDLRNVIELVGNVKLSRQIPLLTSLIS